MAGKKIAFDGVASYVGDCYGGDGVEIVSCDMVIDGLKFDKVSMSPEVHTYLALTVGKTKNRFWMAENKDRKILASVRTESGELHEPKLKTSKGVFFALILGGIIGAVVGTIIGVLSDGMGSFYFDGASVAIMTTWALTVFALFMQFRNKKTSTSKKIITGVGGLVIGWALGLILHFSGGAGTFSFGRWDSSTVGVIAWVATTAYVFKKIMNKVESMYDLRTFTDGEAADIGTKRFGL